MNNLDQYEFERYIPVLRKAASKYRAYFANDGEEAYSELSLALWEALLYYIEKSAEFNEKLAMTVCINHAKYYIRKQLTQMRGGGKQFVTSDITLIGDVIEGSNNIDAMLESTHMREVLNNVLAIANEGERKLVEHRLSNEKQSNRALASQLGISKSTVHDRLKSLHKRYLKQYA